MEKNRLIRLGKAHVFGGYIYREFKEGLTEDVIFEQQLKGGEVGSPGSMGRTSL